MLMAVRWPFKKEAHVYQIEHLDLGAKIICCQI